MNLFLFHSPAEGPEDKTPYQMSIPVFKPPHTTIEDSEFSDGVIRIKDQPLMYTEGCIAAGCPEDLW